jgi:hypothetical protein
MDDAPGAPRSPLPQGKGPRTTSTYGKGKEKGDDITSTVSPQEDKADSNEEKPLTS